MTIFLNFLFLFSICLLMLFFMYIVFLISEKFGLMVGTFVVCAAISLFFAIIVSHRGNLLTSGENEVQFAQEQK